MSVLIKHMAMPKGCIYANDKDQTEYCPLLNHDDVPFCQYIENEPEIAIGIDERPVYCPLSDVPEPCEDAISRQAAIDEIDEWIKAFRENGHKESAADACLIQDGIIQLPSAQPEITLESAIDYLHSIGWMQKRDKEITESSYSEGYTVAESKYRKMWDEIVHCKDCIHLKERLPVCNRVRQPGYGVNDFCSKGERRTDERI